MKIILFLLLIAATSFAQVTQEWVARYDNSGNISDRATSIAVDGSYNVYVAGESINSGIPRFLTIKYNSAGDTLWVRSYTVPVANAGGATAIAVDASGNVYVTGGAFTTIKYNASGVQQWLVQYWPGGNTGLQARDIAVDNQGNVYVTGGGHESSSNNDYVTIKYDPAGIPLWIQVYDGPGNDVDNASSMAVDAVGNVVVTGRSWGSGTGSDYATIKYNTSGTQQWVARYHWSTEDIATAVAIDQSGNIYVTGSSADPNSLYDYATIKYNSSGEQQWVARYDGLASNNDFPTSIALSTSGNVHVTGRSQGLGTFMDYATIKYNNSGEIIWTQRYNGPANDDGAFDITLDNSENVYVTGTSYGSGTITDYATIKYDASGGEVWVQRYNGPNNSNDEAAAITVDLLNNVYVTGGSTGSGTGYDFATIKYSQGITITSPQAGEKWIAGEVDTIKWRGPQENGWEIFISDDDGFSYKSLNVILPANDSMFVWTPPDSLETSSYYRIKVIDVLNNALFAVSEQFTIRAYDLVRLTSDGKYEVYKPSLHGWSVVNYSDYIWPSSWYNQYDYRTGEDPFTLEPYYNKFAILTRAKSSDFPDWPTFVETFGVEKCYEIGFISGNPYQPKQRAMEAWSILKMDYAGACFGFPSSALLAFEQSSEFFSQNQLLQFTPTIFYLNALIPIRKTIIKYFLYQSDATSLAYNNDKFTISVRETLEEIKDMLMDDNGPHRILSLQPPEPGGHAVIPHKLVRDPVVEGQYKLYVYDPNSPGENREFILLDSLGNTWQEFLDLDYGIASDGLFLGLPITHFLQVPILEPLEKSNTTLSKNNADALADLSSVSLYTQTKSDLLILSDTGDSLGYVGGNLIRKMANAGPIIPAVGGFTSPIGYMMPSANYSLCLSQFEDSLSTVLFSEDGILYRYERLNPQLNQIDKFTLGNGISVFSDEEKEILLRTVGSNNKEIEYELSNMTILAGDSLRTIHSLDDELLVSNKGSDKSYDLRVHQLDSYRSIDFENYNISLSENTTHYLSLVDSLLTAVRILIDIGNDGTIDDTLYVQNTVNVEDQESLISPNSYNLAQNYPNPFNPTTTIQFSIPHKSNVTLKVYDVLGNEIATLVNEEKDRGVYSVNFSAKGGSDSGGDASQLASGIYLYRLQAGSFIQTKKMILLR